MHSAAVRAYDTSTSTRYHRESEGFLPWYASLGVVGTGTNSCNSCNNLYANCTGVSLLFVLRDPAVDTSVHSQTLSRNSLEDLLPKAVLLLPETCRSLRDS
eukprot:737761-Rhodomonas_salina.2